MEAMTLEQVRRSMRKYVMSQHRMPMGKVKEWASAIDAHLSQPAQAVDVVAIREVIELLLETSSDDAMVIVDKLTRAISGEKAARVGDGTVPVKRDLLESCVQMLFSASDGRENIFASHARELMQALPASPTPDKEG